MTTHEFAHIVADYLFTDRALNEPDDPIARLALADCFDELGMTDAAKKLREPSFPLYFGDMDSSTARFDAQELFAERVNDDVIAQSLLAEAQFYTSRERAMFAAGYDHVGNYCDIFVCVDSKKNAIDTLRNDLR